MEGVDGSSPSEGLRKDCKRILFLPGSHETPYRNLSAEPKSWLPCRRPPPDLAGAAGQSSARDGPLHV
jgi:hypothetical protein